MKITIALLLTTIFLSSCDYSSNHDRNHDHPVFPRDGIKTLQSPTLKQSPLPLVEPTALERLPVYQVPSPLNLFGIAAAWRWSRHIRRRIRLSR